MTVPADAVTLSVSIARPWREVYDAFCEPEAFARWASGLSQAHLHADGDGWAGDGPEGPIRVTFTAPNSFGVMDHWVDVGHGKPVVYIPLRVLENGGGAEVILTLLRQPDMDDATFERDQNWVRKDLAKLKVLAETDGAA